MYTNVTDAYGASAFEISATPVAGWVHTSWYVR